MPKQKISAKELIADIRSGMDDAALAEKYKLSAQRLQSIFNKLIAAGALQQAELDDRGTSQQQTVNLPWKCPACGKPQPRELEECPDCGIIVAKFLKQQEDKRERETVDQFIEEQLQQEKAKEASKKPEESEAEQKHPLMGLVVVLVVLGVAGLFASLFMDTTKSTPLGPVHNIGLMQQQSLFAGISGLCILIAVILYVAGRWWGRMEAEKEGQKNVADHGTANFCHKCGQKLMQESRFCPGCGSQITVHSGNDA